MTHTLPIKGAPPRRAHHRAAALIRRKKPRRTLAALAIIVGALLMWLSPEVLGGALLMAAGILLEILGIWLEHRV